MLRVKAAWSGGVVGRPGWFLELQLDHETWEEDVAELKRRVPADDRSFDEESKRWWVAEEWAQELATFVGGFAVYLNQLRMDL